jgi:hypothetical protein
MAHHSRTYSFYGGSEIEDLLAEFQKKNNIHSKSKAIKVLLDAGLRNWSHPEEVRGYGGMSGKKPDSPNRKPPRRRHYELVTGSRS